MAITIIQSITASSHVPAFNDQWFTATSSQTAQPNFQFYVTVTIYYNNGTSWVSKSYNESINTPPDGFLRFNVVSYTKGFCENYFPIVSSITNAWNRCTNGLLKIVINIGERYGTTPAVYTGSNITYYTWNASLTDLEMYTYNQNNYLTKNGATFIPLNKFPDSNIMHYSQASLFFLCESDNVISKCKVINNDGSTQLFFDIANPMLASGNWYDRYICFQLNPQYLSSIGGANWIAVNGTTVTLQFFDNTSTLRYAYQFIYNDICTKYNNYNILYLNKNGAYDYKNFEFFSEDNYTIEKTKIRTNHYQDKGSTGYNNIFPWVSSNKTNTSQVSNSLKLTTDVLNESQIDSLLDLITSTVVFLQDTSIQNFYTLHYVNNEDTKYLRNNKWNEKTFQLSATFELSHVHNRQRA